MAVQLQIVGSGTLPGGKFQWEVPTVSNTEGEPEIRSIRLKANVDFKVEVPVKSKCWSTSFQTAASPAEIKVRTNLNAGDEGYPMSGLAGAKMDLPTGVTELIFKSASPGLSFDLLLM